MNQELEEYIKKSREAGQPDQQIKENLLKAGWKNEEINNALLSRNNNQDSDHSENIETILTFFKAVSLAYIFIVPLFVALLGVGKVGELPFYLIASSGYPIFPDSLSFITGIYLGPISIIGGILGLISVKLIKKKKIVGLIILTILVILAVFLTIIAWSNFVNPYFYYHSSSM